MSLLRSYERRTDRTFSTCFTSIRHPSSLIRTCLILGNFNCAEGHLAMWPFVPTRCRSWRRNACTMVLCDQYPIPTALDRVCVSIGVHTPSDARSASFGLNSRFLSLEWLDSTGKVRTAAGRSAAIAHLSPHLTTSLGQMHSCKRAVQSHRSSSPIANKYGPLCHDIGTLVSQSPQDPDSRYPSKTSKSSCGAIHTYHVAY